MKRTALLNMAELGAVASINRIADVGFRLSVKLFAFAETVASADKAIISTSKDVSLTASVLREVGQVLRKDQTFRTCSPEAIKTATAIVIEVLRSVYRNGKGACRKGPQYQPEPPRQDFKRYHGAGAFQMALLAAEVAIASKQPRRAQIYPVGHAQCHHLPKIY